MSGLIPKTTVAGVLLIAGYVVSGYVHSGYEFVIAPPQKDLDDFPAALGIWEQGAETGIEERTLEVMNSDSHISRGYHNAETDTAIGFHAAVWTDPMEVAYGTPHPPNVCYTGAGWHIVAQELVPVETEWGTVPLMLMSWEKNGELVVTGHWYQIGQDLVTNRDAGRAVHRKFWGKPELPSTLKVLLQARNVSLEGARPGMKDFAEQVFSWTHDFAPSLESAGPDVQQSAG